MKKTIAIIQIFGGLSIISGCLRVIAESACSLEMFSLLLSDRERGMFFAVFGVSSILSALLIASGFGLLKLRRWGRRLSLLYAATEIAFAAALIVYGIIMNWGALSGFIGPEILGRVFKEPLATIFFIKEVSVWRFPGEMIYPIALLVVFNLKAVKRQFVSK